MVRSGAASKTSHNGRVRRGVAWFSAAALTAAGLVLVTPTAGATATASDQSRLASEQKVQRDFEPSYERSLTGQLDGSRSYATVKHLAEQIGPRVNGTPAERRAAEYLRDLLEPYGYQVKLQSWGPVSTKRTADIVAAANSTLPGGPKWQMAASASGVFTGDGAPVTGEVTSVGFGQSADDYVDAAGKIAFATVSGSAERAQAMTLAAANGAIAVILAPPVPANGKSSPRAPSFPDGTDSVSIPVLGAGSDHTGWLNQALDAGPLSLRIVTNEYVDPMGTNIIATRHAVGDPNGTTAPIVMVGAHIDSVLGAPGAHDDASGNGVSTEIARVLATMPYDKEIRIGGFGGEEAGLLGARAYVKTLTSAEKNRFVGEWQMDMVGTTYEPARLWALTPDGKSNYVVDQAYEAAERDGFDGLKNCKLGQSDHQAFFDVGIPAALFIWLDYKQPEAPETCESIRRGRYQTEPEYHQPSDLMANVSEPRLQTTLDVVGGAVIHNALNSLNVEVKTDTGAPLTSAQVLVDCGDGDHDAGITGDQGRTATRVPHGRCTLSTGQGSSRVTKRVRVSGDQQVSLTLDTTAPSIEIIRPADGATYQVDSNVSALYFCEDAAGTTCTGTLRRGVYLDTSEPGTYAFTVDAADPNGNTSSKTVHYKVGTPAAVTLSASAGPSQYGKKPVVRVTLGPDSLSRGGRIQIRAHGSLVAKAPGNPGVQKVRLPKRELRPGIHKLRVVYRDSTGSKKASTNTRVRITKADSTLKIKRAVARKSALGKVKVKVNVTPRNVTRDASGKVVVRNGRRVVGHGGLHNGKANVRLRPIHQRGKITLKVTYKGNALIRGDSAKVSLRIRR